MTLRFGRYEAMGKLGEGAMAAVHLARDPVLDRLVAVKVLHRSVATGKTALQRFFNEAKTVARLANPHVVEVFDFGRQGREYYLVMEFVDGRSLRGMLQAPGRPLPDEITVSLLCQAAEGLDMAARHGVVHRDIKPENLMVNSQGYLKVADFGIAHLQDDTLTRTGAVLGSPLYMSPEQVRGAKPITSQSDMFSLGAVFYRCLTGYPPFESATLKELFRRIAQEAPAPLAQVRPDLDPALIRLVETLLQKDPSRRGDGPRWFRAGLRAWLLARGTDDPMERVGRYLLELDGQDGPAAGRQAADAPLPRTVLSASPPALPERTSSFAATRPQGEAAAPTLAGRPPRSSRVRWWGAVCAGLLVTFLGAGGYLHFRTGSGSRTEVPREEGISGTTVGTTVGTLVGMAVGTRENHAPGGGGEAGDGAIPQAALVDAQEREPGADSGRDGAAGTPGEGSVPADSPGSDPAAGNSAGATGALLVQSAPPFAQVFLDGNAMGVAPVLLAALTPGRHRLLIKGRSGAALDTVIEVRPGRRILRVRLEPEIVALESPE